MVGLQDNLHVLAVAALLLVVSVLLITGMNEVSPLWDEPSYISSGYYFFKTGDPSMMVGHPMLGKEIAALPLLLLHPAPALPPDASSYVDYSYVKFAYDFMYRSDNDAYRILFWSRLPFVFLFALLGFAVYRWAAELYGKRAGVFSVLLYSFSPLVLANAGVALTDFPVVVFIFLTMYFFWRFIRDQSSKYVALTGVSLGLALASKETATYLLPIMLLLFGILWWKGRLPPVPWLISPKLAGSRWRPAVVIGSFMVVVVLIALGVVWVVYGFQFGSLAAEGGSARYMAIAVKELSGILPGPVVAVAEHVAESIPVPFPSFIATYGLAINDAAKPRIHAYLNGEVYVGGKWQFYVVAFILKTPIPFLIMLLLAVLMLPWLHHRDSINEFFLLLPPMLLFAAFFPAKFNVGLKHLLPMFPFLFVFCSKLVALKLVRLPKLAFALFLAALSIWYVGGTLAVHPQYVSYFNEFVGPENGHKYLAGADLSPGGNLIGLKEYMGVHNIPSIQLSYLGNADPAYYGINYTYLPSPFFQGWDPHYSPQLPPNYTEQCYPRAGLIAISASNLHGVNLVNTSCYEWLEPLTPIAKIGYEIFIYNVSESDAGSIKS